MTVRTTFVDVSDGDQLNSGYFNGIKSLGTNNHPTMVPVGAVVAWLKSFTGVPQTLPIGWVECDGSVISDGDSPMDGQTVPDLNGDNRFLRGETTSGGTGGSESHTHSIGASDEGGFATGGLGPVKNPDANTGSTSTLPTYYEVLWIIRIK